MGQKVHREQELDEAVELVNELVGFLRAKKVSIGLALLTVPGFLAETLHATEDGTLKMAETYIDSMKVVTLSILKDNGWK